MAEGSVWQDVLWIVGAITAVLLMFEALRRTVVSPLIKWIRVMVDFLMDWNGHPAREGHDAVPGVMATLKDMSDKMQRVEYHTGNGDEPALRQIVKDNARRLETHIDETEVLINEARAREAEQNSRLTTLEIALGLRDNDRGDGHADPR